MQTARLVLFYLTGFLLVACGGDGPPPGGEQQYTAFTNPEIVTVNGYNGDIMEPFISRDGQFLFFNNNSLAVPADKDIFYATHVDATTFNFAGEVVGVNNSSAVDGVPTLDSANTFYYVTTAFYDPNPPAHYDTIYKGNFDPATGNVSGIVPVDGVAEGIAGHLNFDVEVSPDGNTLYTVDGIFSGNSFPDQSNIIVATKAGSGFVRDPASTTIMVNINTQDLEYASAISADGLELFFTRLRLSDFDTKIYRAVRPNISASFGKPQHVSTITGFIEAPAFSPDEKSLYYHRRNPTTGRFELFRVTRP